MNLLKYFIVGLLLTISAGCSSVKSYTSTQDKNFSVRAKIDVKNVEAEIYILGGLKECEDKDELTPLGRVKLQPGETIIGLTPGKFYLLKIYFNTKNFFGDEIANTLQRAYVTPKPGKKYRVNLNYEDRMYDVTILEMDMKSSSGTRVPIVAFHACK